MTDAPEAPGSHAHGEAGRRPLLIGLTGPIGCGKSTVARWLAGRGAAVIDADHVARDVTAPGTPGHALVLARFGPAFRRRDGSLDRAALGRLVFADPAALATLETIVHPLVRPVILATIADAAAAGVTVVAIEAIKLVESGYAAICDEVWLVTCPPAEQLQRLVERGVAPMDARQRARAQAGMVERLAGSASLVLDTGGPPEVARMHVEEALEAAIARHAAVTGDRSRGRGPSKGSGPGDRGPGGSEPLGPAPATDSGSAPAS